MRGQEDPDFGLARQGFYGRDDARTIQTNNTFFLFRSGGGFPGLPMRGQRDPEFGLGRQSFHGRGHARTIPTNNYF